MNHTWQTDEDGEPDRAAMYAEEPGGRGHNGPICTVCAFAFCEHCHPEWWKSECAGKPVSAAWQPPEPARP